MADSRHTRNQDNPEDLNAWGMPKMREPDYSDVRRHIFAPRRILVFIVVSIIIWLIFYHFFPNTGPQLPKKGSPPTAAETQK
jgi:hypothetical protein